MKRPVARRLRCLAVVISVLVAGSMVAQACNVPVFRYALERWRPDAYRVTVFHRGPMTDEQQTLLRPWQASAAGSPVNVALRYVDVDSIENDVDRALFAAQASASLPALVVQYPQSLRVEKPIWSGPLNVESRDLLAASPLRSELIRRLASGETAVWLMVECGHAEKDDAMAAKLTDELQTLAQTLKLPDLTSAPEDNLLSSAPLKVDFSLMRVPRDAAGEDLLVAMLLHSESDLLEFDEPMVFPVFGRGRALLPLIGAGISTDNIQGSAEFLVGACSCEIKELNPGFDLLLNADWDELLFEETPPAELLASRAAVPSGEPEMVPIPSGAAATATKDVSHADAKPEKYEPTTSTTTALKPSYATGMMLVGLALVAVVIAIKRFL